MKYSNIESELLVLSVKFQINPSDNDKITIINALNKKINWNYLYSIAWSHKVIPILWNTLKDIHPNDIPLATVTNFDNYCVRIRTNNSQKIIELKKLIFLFKENNIPIISYKGPALLALYKNFDQRRWNDIDLIIKIEDLQKVEMLLLSNKYLHDNETFNHNTIKNFVTTYHSTVFVKNDKSIKIDVHWRLEDAKENLCYPMGQMWHEYVEKKIFDIFIPILSTRDLILSTCLHHGFRGSWAELKFISDFALIIKTFINLDWEKVIIEAKIIGFGRALLVGCSLSNLIFSINLPLIVNEYILKDASIEKLTSLILKGLSTNLKQTKRENTLYSYKIKIRMREKCSDKLFLIFNLLSRKIAIFLPNENDTKFIPLPRYLYFMYFFLKPIRLIRKHGMKYLFAIRKK